MTLSEKAGDLLYTFTHHLTDIIENDILDKGRYVEEPERYDYTVLHKVRNILDACSFLVKNLDDKPHYYDSTFLLLRTCLFDIVSLYFIMDMEKDLPLQQQRIERIMYDHVKSIWTCAQNDAERQLVREKFPQCFADGKFRKDIMKINIIIMLEEIQLVTFKKEVRRAIDLYNIFSKVEHNGILSFNLLHAHYEQQGANIAKSKVYLAIKIIMTGISLLVVGVWQIPLQDGRFKELVRTNNELKLN